MPTPFELITDPLSLGLTGLFVVLILLETTFPARKLAPVKGWRLKCFLGFVIYFFLASYLPLVWDQYLTSFQVFDLSGFHQGWVLLIAVLIFELFIYLWHRCMHRFDWLWLRFHQMHHSAERVDAWGAYFFSPMDMIGFTFIGSLSLSILIGMAPDTVTQFLYITTFFAIFQHTNIKTPVWLGYLIQRPESHSVHHQRGVHAHNYSDLPVFDLLFGTFKNPKTFQTESGFYLGASNRVSEMLMAKDISQATTVNKSEANHSHP